MREGIEGKGFGNVPELIADVRDSAQVRIFACLLYDIFENDVGQVDTTGVELYAEREFHSGVECSMQARLPPPAPDVNDAAVRASRNDASMRNDQPSASIAVLWAATCSMHRGIMPRISPVPVPWRVCVCIMDRNARDEPYEQIRC